MFESTVDASLLDGGLAANGYYRHWQSKEDDDN